MASLDQAESGPGLMVILGEPGSGKTTLMRRIGADLAAKNRLVLELRPSMRTSLDWYPLVADLRAKVGQPVILIDDIFRCPGIEELFADPALDCIVLGTTRTNEDRSNTIRAASSLRFLKITPDENSKASWTLLTSPSDHELALLRERKECREYSDREWEKLTTIRKDGSRVGAHRILNSPT